MRRLDTRLNRSNEQINQTMPKTESSTKVQQFVYVYVFSEIKIYCGDYITKLIFVL